MKLLIKFPTRGRPQKAIETLEKYLELANDVSNITILVTIDEDDITVTEKMFKIHPCVQVKRGISNGKISAINRDMPNSCFFDIVLLASDDMIPQINGYDNIIRSKMEEHFPDTDGVLFFNDGYAGFRLNTLVICGSKYYQRFGYLYCPEYTSLFCDNEFMDEANRLGGQIYFDDVIIKHEHPANNKSINNDNLYDKNSTFWDTDKSIYEARKFRNYDVSVLICTIPSRKDMFIRLLNKLTVLKRSTNLSIEIIYDNEENAPIGKKRNKLLNTALGKYCAFIDDDDDVTDDYFKIIEESELKYDCIALNGIMYINGVKYAPFYHSLQYSKWIDKPGEAYYRNPNHLNPMKTEIAKQIRFPETNYHEDREFSQKLLDMKLLRTEYLHSKLQYIYLYVSNKKVKTEQQMSSQKFIKSIFNII